MNSWSLRRRRIALFIAIACLVVVIGIPGYFLFSSKSVSCSDGKQNGDETGVDCGGSCPSLCTNQSLPLILKGDPQVLKVASSTYEVVVYVQNPNVTGEIYSAGYELKLYESGNSVPIKIIDDTVYVPRNSDFVVFQGPFDMSQYQPVRASFAWKDNSILFQKNTENIPSLDISSVDLTNVSTTPKLNASIKNTSLNQVQNIGLTALMFDSSGTIIAASKTFVDSLAPGNSAPIVFTWPAPFNGTVVSETILPVIYPDKSFIH